MHAGYMKYDKNNFVNKSTRFSLPILLSSHIIFKKDGYSYYVQVRFVTIHPI